LLQKNDSLAGRAAAILAAVSKRKKTEAGAAYAAKVSKEK
jgi:hypothetical protein